MRSAIGFKRLVLLTLMLGAPPLEGRAASSNDARPELQSEIAAGGLIFSNNLNLTIEQQDLTLAPDAVQVRYAIRNGDSADHTITIAFPFPDVDGGASPDMFGKRDSAVENAWPENVMDVVMAVDGRRPNYAIEQRASAVGLDVTKAILDAGLPLFPHAADLERRLADLDPAIRDDLIERGILKIDDDVVSPSWTLKTVAHWRQRFPAGETVPLALQYKPLTGRNAFSSGALQPLVKGVCINAGLEQSIMQLATEGSAMTMAAVAYIAHPGAEALGPVGRFRLTVETSDPKSIVATCRQGLTRTSPTTIDLTALNHSMDEDFRFLFVR
jgi:Domain of unknown function (DUF4424)